ncbi:MAG: cupin domain-containing protein [Polynucleobacter sp.]
MNQIAFLKVLSQDGFPEPVLVVREQGGFLENHTHPFEVRALVTQGQIDIVIDGHKKTYLAGDVFHLMHSQEHAESYGNQGVRYLASRKD